MQENGRGMAGSPAETLLCKAHRAPRHVVSNSFDFPVLTEHCTLCYKQYVGYYLDAHNGQRMER